MVEAWICVCLPFDLLRARYSKAEGAGCYGGFFWVRLGSAFWPVVKCWMQARVGSAWLGSRG